MKKRKSELWAALFLLAAFALWTAALRRVDVQAVGPEGSAVGFAALNLFFRQRIGVHMALYTLTDWLGLVPLGVALGFALLGLTQLLRRRSLFRVDRSILTLGGFYVLVLAVYLFFERFAVNYRPVLIDGRLEASYPSSTTVLTLCILPTAMMQLRARIRNRPLRLAVLAAMAAFTGFMVAGRWLSGVHWTTDVLGGILFSAGAVMLYRAVSVWPEK